VGWLVQCAPKPRDEPPELRRESPATRDGRELAQETTFVNGHTWLNVSPQTPPPNVMKTSSSAKKLMPVPMRLAQAGNLFAKANIAPLPANPISGTRT